MDHSKFTEYADVAKQIELDRLEANLRDQLRGRIGNLRILLQGNGFVLRGEAYSFYGKQLAQHAVMSGTDLPLLANEIQVA